MAVIARPSAAPCLMLGLAQAILHQDGRMLGRVVLAAPGSMLLTLAAVAVTRTLLVATDQMSLWLIGASGRDLGEFGTKMAATLAASPGTSAFVVFLVSAFAAVCGLVLWIELLIRAALVYVLLAFFPVMAALMIWPSTAGGIRRLIRLLVAIVLSKVVIVGVVAMGVAAASSSGVDDRFEGLLVGVAMVAIACFAPMAIHRLLPVLEEAVQVRGSLSAGGGLRSAQTGHYSASAARDVVSQLRAARAASPGAGAGGAGGAGTPAAAGGRMPRLRAGGRDGRPIGGGR